MYLQLAFALTLLFLVGQLGSFLENLYLSPTRSVPGPFAARLSKLWYLNHIRKGQFHIENIALHQKYGPIVRLAPRWYSISTPSKAVYGIGSKFRKSTWYEGWKHPSPDRWTMFPDQDIKRHAETRKRFQSLYSLSSLLDYEPYVEQCSDIFAKKLTELAEKREVVDMVHWFKCYAFDVMGDVTYSKRFGFLDNGQDINGIMKALDRSMVYSTLVGVYDWAHPYIYPIMEKFPGNGAAGRTYLMQLVRGWIEARNQGRKEKGYVAASEGDTDVPQDFLEKLTVAHENDASKVTSYHIFMMGLSNIIAGSDTTAISMSSTLYHLITNPSSLKRLRDEIDAHEWENGHMPFKTANEMPYLKAVVKEALRMFPASGLPLWRVVPEGGAEIQGQRFEAGDIVGLNSWVAHYDKEVYGDDVYEFRPERWLEVEVDGQEERRREMEANWMAFGLGSRTCIGRHVSTLEMYKTIPDLIRKFDFEIAMPKEDWKGEDYWFVMPQKLDVRVAVRRNRRDSMF